MRELIALALCALMTLTPAACGTNDTAPDDVLIGGDSATWGPDNQPAGTENVQIANPFVDCQTLADAEQHAGFSMTLPAQIDGYDVELIQTVENEMIQVIYRDAADGEIVIRKAAGDGDISGDYTVYDAVRTVEAGARQVTVKGDGDSVRLAVWTEDGHAFSVWSSTAMDELSMLSLIAAVQ